MLSEERELFQSKVRELEAALQAKNGDLHHDLDRVTDLAVRYEKELGQARFDLEGVSEDLEITKRELSDTRTQLKTSQAFAKEMQETLHLQELDGNKRSRDLKSSAKRVKLLEDFLQSKLGSALGDIARAQEAMEGELTCMTCLDLLHQPVFILPGETRCCSKCIPAEVENSEAFEVYADPVCDTLSGKFLFVRQALHRVRKEVDAALKQQVEIDY